MLLKGTTTKISTQEEGFPNFLRPLTTAGVPLMKSVLTPLAEIFDFIKIICKNVSSKCSYSK